MGARERKRHVQLELLNQKGTGRARLKRKRGGRSPGRPRKKGRRKTAHARRAMVRPGQPVHVVLRVVGAVGNLRRRDCYRALRAATLVVAPRGEVTVARGDRVIARGEVRGEVRGVARDGGVDIRRAGKAFGAFRIVHLSMQRDHVHLLVEADDRVALSRGMQAFQISAAKHLNAVLGNGEVRRRGRVFADRYHARSIANRRQARNALAYVLNNWRKHREDRGVSWRVDPFSTGHAFGGWRRRDRGSDGMVECGWERPPDDRLFVAWEPRSWLLRVGWEMYGALAVDEVPSTPAWVR